MEDFAKLILTDIALEQIEPKAKQNAPRNPLDHWPPAILLERAAYLKKMAKYGDGSADETLRDYPQHKAILLYRSRSGEVKVHQNFADLFCVLAGNATLLTGGTVVNARTSEFGETRGDSIEGGSRQELKAGDFAHVPAGLPHQMLISGEKSIACLVIKVQEIL